MGWCYLSPGTSALTCSIVELLGEQFGCKWLLVSNLSAVTLRGIHLWVSSPAVIFSGMADRVGKFGQHHFALWKSKGLCVQLQMLPYCKHWRAAIFLFVSLEKKVAPLQLSCWLNIQGFCSMNVALLLLCGRMVGQTTPKYFFPFDSWTCLLHSIWLQKCLTFSSIQIVQYP